MREAIPALNTKIAEQPMTLSNNQGCPQTPVDPFIGVHSECNENLFAVTL